MKVNDIKVFNPDDAEVTDKLILNTEFVMKYITQNIQDNLKYDQICRIFKELRKFYTIDVEFDRVEFDFKNKVVSFFKDKWKPKGIFKFVLKFGLNKFIVRCF